MKFLLMAISLASFAWGNIVIDSHQEKIHLQNIQQVTFLSMGFEKAGEAYFSPDGNSIIFQAVPNGEKDYQIYTLNLNEKSPLMVSTGKGNCTCGFYRPDGKKIIFASSHESPLINEKAPHTTSNNYVWDLTPYMQIYEAELDGSNLKCLTSGPAYHAECGYSPDGKSIVYASNESGSMNIYVCNADGSNVEPLTHTNYSYNGGPFFSPDGKWIIFRADREKKDILQLFLISVDGKQEKQLTNNEHVNWAPFWHPNNRFIAYTTSKHGHRAYQIYLLDIETGEEYRLTHSSTFEGLPSFSKNGRKIVWTSKRGNSAPQIFIADFFLPGKT